MVKLDNHNYIEADLALIQGSGFTFNSSGFKETGFLPFAAFFSASAMSIFDSSDGGRYFTRNDGKTILVFNKRIHPYQGFSALDSVLPVKIALLSKAKAILLSNASGGLNPEIKKGEFLVIARNLIFPRFPDFDPDFTNDEIERLDNTFNSELTDILIDCVSNVAGKGQTATYAYMTGPAYETQSEVEFLKSMGADIVGMSTAYESLFAALSGLKAAGLSIVTNVHRNDQNFDTTHDEVLEESQNKQEIYNRIVSEFFNILTK